MPGRVDQPPPGSSAEGQGGAAPLDPTLPGAGSAAAMPSGDDFVSDVQLSVHPRVKTGVVVTWMQQLESGSSSRSRMAS